MLLDSFIMFVRTYISSWLLAPGACPKSVTMGKGRTAKIKAVNLCLSGFFNGVESWSPINSSFMKQPTTPPSLAPFSFAPQPQVFPFSVQLNYYYNNRKLRLISTNVQVFKSVRIAKCQTVGDLGPIARCADNVEQEAT